MNDARARLLAALVLSGCGTSTMDLGHDPPSGDPGPATPAPAERGNAANAPWTGTTANPTDSDWEWLNPSPQGNTVRAVWGSANDDVWLVGDGDTIVHWDGSEWQRMDPGTHGATFSAVWSSSNHDVWFAGRDPYPFLKHWDGTSWSKHLTGEKGVSALWGKAPNDVWSVSLDEIRHWDGAQWRTAPNPFPGVLFRDLWGAATDDVWAVGDRGFVLHWNGTSWSRVAAPNPGAADDPFLESNGYVGVWGSAANDVWAVFETPGVTGFVHWDGSAWRIVNTVANQAGPVTANGIASETGHRVWGTDARNVMALAGGSGSVWYWDGAVWSPAPFRTDGTLVDLGMPALFGSSPDGFLAAGWAGRLLRFDPTVPKDDVNGRWRDVLPGVHDDLRAVSVLAAGDAWAISAGQVLHWTAGGWSARHSHDLAMPSGKTHVVSFNDVHARSADDVWVAGEDTSADPAGFALHWDGIGWGATWFPEAIAGIWGVGPEAAWAVGDEGLYGESRIYRWDGAVWSAVPSPVSELDLTSVAASSADDVWIAGVDVRVQQRLCILHWDGALLVEAYRGPPVGWVSGSSDPRILIRGPKDVWVTDLSGGPPVHWDGAAFSRVDFGLPEDSFIHSFATLTGQDLWFLSGDASSAAVAGQGEPSTLWRYDGKTATPVRQLTATRTRISAAGDEALWIVGSGGATLRYRAPAKPPR